MRSPTDFLKPEAVAKLRGIDLRARLVVEGFLAGLHRSPYKGFSVEFTEHRQYIPGDELKRVDWKVYGRTDRFYIREYEEETNLRAWLVVDTSGSMAYAGSAMSKLEYSGCLAASLAYLLLHQKDSCGLVTFSDRIDRYLPPRSTPAHLHAVLRELARAKPGGDTDVGSTLDSLAERIKRRGLVVVISDLWDDEGRVLRALRHFRHRRHEVIVFHVTEPVEAGLDFRGPVVLRDLETGRELTVDPRVIGADYRKSWQRRCAELERGCAEALVDYCRVSTATPFDRALFAYLERRRRIG
jgi:uncharacterized protein (DUF58 family)